MSAAPRFLIQLVLMLTMAAKPWSSIWAVQLKPVAKPWLRLEGSPSFIKSAPKGRYIAYCERDGSGLFVIDTKTEHVRVVTRHLIEGAFFWSPDGARLFYREHKFKNKQITSVVKTFNTADNRTTVIAEYNHPTGFLTFDPRDLRFALIYNGGIHAQRLYFPSERLAQWQIAQRRQTGRWAVAQKAVTWVSQGGFQLTTLKDDGSGIQSFDISPDGSYIVWATKKGNIYVSQEGKAAKHLTTGHDPQWHPYKQIIVYAAGPALYERAPNYDIRIMDLHGSGYYLLRTPEIAERWPAWSAHGEKVYYTKKNTTDLYEINFEQEMKDSHLTSFKDSAPHPSY